MLACCLHGDYYVSRAIRSRLVVSALTTSKKGTNCGSCRVITATTPSASTRGWSRRSASVPSAGNGSSSPTSAAPDSSPSRPRTRPDQTRTRTTPGTAAAREQQLRRGRQLLPLPRRQRGNLFSPRRGGRRAHATPNERGATLEGQL